MLGEPDLRPEDVVNRCSRPRSGFPNPALVSSGVGAMWKVPTAPFRSHVSFSAWRTARRASTDQASGGVVVEPQTRDQPEAFEGFQLSFEELARQDDLEALVRRDDVDGPEVEWLFTLLGGRGRLTKMSPTGFDSRSTP